MSYCRWSSDDFKSDVYTYEHVDGSWTTHVAGRRRLGLDTLPPSPYTIEALADKEGWNAKYRGYHDALGKLEFEEIALPYVGETFKDDSPGACADTLKMLSETGYHVPDGVIEVLREEQLALTSAYGGDEK